MFTEGLSLIEMIKIVAECDELLDNEAFMTSFIFSIKSAIVAYKVIIDYAEMLGEISTVDYNLADLNDIDSWNSVVNSLEILDEKAGDFHLILTMYHYFLVDNGIKEPEVFENQTRYGRKRAKEILAGPSKDSEGNSVNPEYTGYPFTSLELIPSQLEKEEGEENKGLGIEESKEKLISYDVPIFNEIESSI